MLVEVVLTLILIFGGVYLYITWNYDFWTKRGVTQIDPRFPWGSFYELFTRRRHINDIFADQAEKFRNQPYYGTFIFKWPVLIILDPDLSRDILVKDFDHFVDRTPAEVMKSFEKSSSKWDQLWSIQKTFFNCGEKWKTLRSTFSPMFTSGRMKNMMALLQNCSKTMCNYIEKEAEDFDAQEVLAKFSMDTIASCAFGVEAQAFAKLDSPFVKHATNVFQQNISDSLKFGLAMLPGGSTLMRLFGMSLYKPETTKFFHDVILATLKHRRDTNIRRNDLVDLMLDAVKGDLSDTDNAEGFDELDIVATAITILVAGYDSTTLSFACYQLSQNQDIQDRVRSDIDEVVGDSNEITYDHLKQMTYLDQVIQETMRFCNPLGVLQRATSKPYKFKTGLLHLPEGFPVWINASGTHMDSRHYPNPTIFNPDNFSKENKINRHPYAYLPFGQGPRSCLGMRFAILTAQVGLADIVRNFKLLPSTKTKQPLKLDPQSIVFSVKGGLYIKAERLN